MPLFRTTVALESCPAKTAESVSYGATFAVLGWLLVSNYSGLAPIESANPTVASIEPNTNSNILAAPAFNQTASPIVRTDQTGLTTPQFALFAAETKNLPTPSPLIWHENLQPYQNLGEESGQRTFTTGGWSFNERVTGYTQELDLPLPIAENVFELTSINASAESSRELADNSGLAGDLIREITVTGAPDERLTTRPDNIQRPQIPRPYRAQQLQRTFLLPPRIQALRP